MLSNTCSYFVVVSIRPDKETRRVPVPGVNDVVQQYRNLFPPPGGFGGILRTGAPPGIGRRTSAERVSWSKELAGIREYIKPESPPPAAVGAPTEGDGGGDSSSLSVSMGETIEDEEDEEGGNVFGKIMQWSDFVAQGGMEGAGRGDFVCAGRDGSR